MVDAGQVGAGLFVIGKVLVRGGGDVVLLHEVLRKSLAPLHPSSFLGRPKARYPGGAEVALNASDEWGLGAWDDEVHTELLSKGHETGKIVGRDTCVVGHLGKAGGASVSRHDHDGLDARRLAQLPGQRMLPSAIANEKDAKRRHRDKFQRRLKSSLTFYGRNGDSRRTDSSLRSA
ncbi:hypothetical protein VTK73DRAFT_1338 [Phialemonium thermophilum]|uniref:Uncharacterized protein n=1 Tax=Phialemonium thermophilum TaxID=223376 RepID=A0ABR3XAY6_9PEZI